MVGHHGRADGGGLGGGGGGAHLAAFDAAQQGLVQLGFDRVGDGGAHHGVHAAAFGGGLLLEDAERGAVRDAVELPVAVHQGEEVLADGLVRGDLGGVGQAVGERVEDEVFFAVPAPVEGGFAGAGLGCLAGAGAVGEPARPPPPAVGPPGARFHRRAAGCGAARAAGARVGGPSPAMSSQHRGKPVERG